MEEDKAEEVTNILKIDLKELEEKKEEEKKSEKKKSFMNLSQMVEDISAIREVEGDSTPKKMILHSIEQTTKKRVKSARRYEAPMSASKASSFDSFFN